MYGVPYGPAPYGPPSSAQQRLRELEATYGPYGPGGMGSYPSPTGGPYTPPQPSSSGPLIKGRPVANEQEANAAEIDYDGSLFVFLDKAHGRIYTKQLGMDGNINFNRYFLEMPSVAPQTAAEPANPSGEWVNKGDLSKVLTGIYKRIEDLEHAYLSQDTTEKGGKES